MVEADPRGGLSHLQDFRRREMFRTGRSAFVSGRAAVEATPVALVGDGDAEIADTASKLIGGRLKIYGGGRGEQHGPTLGRVPGHKKGKIGWYASFRSGNVVMSERRRSYGEKTRDYG